ncbi:uncharacterized protein LOC117322670 [Pecten maximus]|uniref:uncharacterized protein LOC117322670 n=1 Tax=Pecten maximus TaxID=6579 RepID=UPI0014581003|nr:uncharacterized protein LOC117322670 [Pecten maximus]
MSSNVTEGCYDPGSYVSKSALVLEAVSFVIHFLVSVAMVCLVCCTECDGGGATGWFGLSLVLFPVAGILSLVGCTKMSDIDISDYTYGSSYNLCLASGIYVMILFSFACCACCCSGSDDDDGGSVNRPKTTVATTPSSGQVLSTYTGTTTEHVGVAVSEHQEVHVSNGMVFVRKMRVMNVVRFMR